MRFLPPASVASREHRAEMRAAHEFVECANNFGLAPGLSRRIQVCVLFEETERLVVHNGEQSQ